MRSRLGLCVKTAAEQGLDAAIEQHDAVSSLPYSKKVTWAGRSSSGIEDNIKELIKEYRNKHSKDFKMSKKSSPYRVTAENNSVQGKPKMNTVTQTAQRLFDINKRVVINTAFLALGKVVIDTATARLPKSVAMLGPLAVAELIAVIPSDNPKVLQAQQAGLVYAMHETYKSTDLASLVDELTGVSDQFNPEDL
jgi:hypothetical protein